jgi:hypothetical protein
MVDLDKTQTLRFEITGTIEIPKDAELVFDAFGEIRGYKISSGKEITLLAALEVNEEKVLSTDNELAEIGCQITDYDITNFYKID